MPTFLRRLLSAELFIGLALAALLPFVDSGMWQVLSPLAALIPVALCAAFWMRAPLADVALGAYCAVAALLGIAFVSAQLLTIHSVILNVTSILAISESLVAGALFFALRSRQARRWFVG
ncbi:hypothetical protein OU995_05835 [Roseateles sp. SL47]|uniref:hypothetical protein n=1 Tax=Roseateles sp. SL47 TaxID=2995138 RepID=UPI002270B445|nr:hypothetical protein [Roseateles sp. SL47]WAC74245.1 hypothetical protein OU995_05835 [Roseateles sp. SL47]